jgi:hypothetical protein
MRSLLFMLALVLPSICTSAEQVEYFSDSIMQKDGNTIRLLGGSSWELSSMTFAMITDDISIIFRTIPETNNRQIPILVHGGMEITARHVEGAYAKSSGFLAYVIDERDDGAILELDDGTILTIPDYDQFDTGWWLPPYQVIVTSNGLYMWNLKEGKRVWVDEVK